MRVHRQNLLSALRLAIHSRQREEVSWGYSSDSALLGGWKEAVRALERGESLDFFPEPRSHAPTQPPDPL